MTKAIGWGMQSWSLYLLICSDLTIYTGITTDIERRVKEHNATNSRTKYTRVRQPVTVYKIMKCRNRAHASRLEYLVKQLSRQDKLTLDLEAFALKWDK